MLDDLRDQIEYIRIRVSRNHKKETTFRKRLIESPLDILVRKTAFNNLFVSLTLLPLNILLIVNTYYPNHTLWWDWVWWRYFVLLTFIIYLIAIVFSGRIRRTKFLYLLQNLYMFPMILATLIFSLRLCYGLFYPENWIGFLLSQVLIVLVLINSFSNQFETLESKIFSEKVKQALLENSIWDHNGFLSEDDGSNSVGSPGGTFILSLTIIPSFLGFTSNILPGIEGDFIKLALVVSYLIYVFVGSYFQSVIIFYHLLNLENEMGFRIFTA